MKARPFTIIRRQFSSKPVVDERCPYVFGNKKELITTRDNTNQHLLKTMASFMMNDKSLREGFSFAYSHLLKSLASMDYESIGSCCERNLFKSFADSLDRMKQNRKKLELMNELTHGGVHLEVIDF
jgi:hypothetical protein